jgi:exonuclease III
MVVYTQFATALFPAFASYSLPYMQLMHPIPLAVPNTCFNMADAATEESSSRITNTTIPTNARVSRPAGPHAILRPRVQFKLGTFNVRTLMQSGQQAGLARTMESLQIDICCLSETRLQDSSSVICLTSPADSSVRFHLRLSGDQAAAAAGLAGVGIALSCRAEAALLDWIPVDSRLCAVRLRGSCKVSRHRNDTYNLFVVSAYAPTDCSSDLVKDQFYHNLHNLLRKAHKRDVVILAGDLNARVGRLSPSEKHLGGHHGLDSVRNDNGDRLLSLCSDHQLFLASTNFRHSRRRSATWRPPSSQQDWTQIDHVAISYRWRSSVQDCRSHWSTCCLLYTSPSPRD